MQSVCLFRYLLIRFICMQDNPKSGGLIWIDFHGWQNGMKCIDYCIDIDCLLNTALPGYEL